MDIKEGYKFKTDKGIECLVVWYGYNREYLIVRLSDYVVLTKAPLKMNCLDYEVEKIKKYY